MTEPARTTPRPPTVEQRQALAAAVNVALSSGAGCGKTTVLTKRFLSALEDRLPLTGLVAVTFTDKAAAEMRGRIRDACRDRLKEGGPEAGYWRKVLRGLEAGRIGTFHSFCLDLLRRHAVQAGLPPEFTVLDAAVAPTIRDEALRACIRRWLADGHDDLVALATELGLDAVRDGLRSLLVGRALADPGRWADLSPDDLFDQWRTTWHAEERPALLRSFVDRWRPFLGMLAANECRHPTGEERRRVLLTEVPLLSEAPEPRMSLDEIRECARVQGGGGAAHWPSDEVYQDVKKGYDDLRSGAGKLAGQLDYDEAATRLAADHGVRFARLAREALAEVDRLKLRREAIDFDDHLLRALGLLGDGELRRQLAEEIDLLLVDEFQDTDRIQGGIVRSLAGDDPEAGRLFLVGDSKQSIYRFRGAKPGIFDEFRGAMTDEGRLALTGNFRSVPGVLDFVNALFCDLYADPTEALRPGRPFQHGPDDPPAVEFVWAVDPANLGSRTSVAERRRCEAQWLARLVADRLERGWMIPDPVEGGYRRARPSDVALLFRAMTSAGIYEQAFEAEGLDYHTTDGSAFFAQQEVLDVVNLLSSVEDPLDPLALAASLRSPFFGVSDEGLFWLANARRDGRPGDLSQNLRHADRVAELSHSDRRRALRARDLLDRWRTSKDRVSIVRLLDQILDESGFEAALVAEPLGDRKRANVRKVLALAGNYDRSGFPLADFAARIRADLRSLAREDQAATTTETGDAVRLMSIHKSKGLEFPIVIVPDLDRAAPPMSKAVVLHERFGPIVRPEADPFAPPADDAATGLGELLYKASEDREERAEAVRLLYVATTRAASHLILSCGLDSTPADCKPRSPGLELIASRFDLATGRIKQPLPDGWAEPRVGVVAEPPPGSSRGPSRQRADRLSVVRAIRRTRPDPLAAREPEPPRSSWVMHDPAAALSPFEARVDRLVRLVLADPDAAWSADLKAALHRAAKSTMPASPPRVVAAAAGLIAPWAAGELGRRVASAEARVGGLSYEQVEPGSSVVHRGSVDLAFREGRSWAIIAVEHPGEPLGAALDRLTRASRAGDALGLGPIGDAWAVRLGPAPAGPVVQAFDPRRLAGASPSTRADPPRRAKRPRRPAATRTERDDDGR